MRLGNPRRRLRAAVIILGLMVSLCGVRLFQLQGLDAADYADQAEAERHFQTVALAERGKILARDGVALASSVDTIAVFANPMLVKNPIDAAIKLAPIVGVDQATLYQRLSEKPRRFVYLAKQLDPRVWRHIEQLELEGIDYEQQSKRIYPAGEVAANVVGFVGHDNRGAGGVELQLNKLLAGHDGELSYERAGDGRQIPTARSDGRDPVPGLDVQLTIDRDLQWTAQRAIAEKVSESGAQSGVVVVQNVRTGEILAMAEAPTFNSNNPGQSRPTDRNNRPTGDIFEPGSINKAITTAAALEEGVATPRTEVTVPGMLRRGGKVFHDHSPHGTLSLTLTGVLAKSSNIGMILTAERLGDEKLYSYLKKFGLGEPTGLDFPGESRGTLAPPEEWSGSQRHTIPFGQGLSLNAVQATSVFATIANGGLRVSPSLVKGHTTADGEFRPTPATKPVRVVSEATARQLRDMMEAVISEDGTAPEAAIPGYRVAGKTGTAQRVDPSCRCYRGYTASFIGFAPADNPQLAVSVILQNPTRGHSGAKLAAPVFRQVMSFALQSLGIPPSNATRPSLPLTPQKR